MVPVNIFGSENSRRHLFLSNDDQDHTSSVMPRRIQEDRRAGILRTVILVVIIFIVGSIAVIRLSEEGGGPSSAETAALAECLTEKGAKMYGAYWCSHCIAQKKLFGAAFDKVDYIECATPGNPRQQTQACDDAGIKGYPTWTFADGSHLSGEISLEALADKAGCPFGSVQAPSDEPPVTEDPESATPPEPSGDQPAS